MNNVYRPAQLAEGRIRMATARLLGKFPYYAHVLERFRLVASASVATVGVKATGTGVGLLFDSDFVLDLPIDQLGGVLLHEILHVVLGHLTINPADFPDPWALTVALEVSANEFVHEPLPDGVIRLEQFPMLPPMESFHARYQRLTQVRKRQDLRTPANNLDGHEEGVCVVLDDHDVWAEALEDREAVQKVLADLVEGAAIEAGGLPPELHQVVQSGIGSLAGEGIHVLHGGRHGRLTWKRLLRLYVGQVLERQPSYQRLPRRFPHLLGILPGNKWSAAHPSVVAVIDTSGSITEDWLEAINGELQLLARSHAVQVVECDRAVHRVFRYRRPLQQVTGRGGTDFRPALATSFLRPLRPGVVVYFTDGFGDAPGKAPPWPLIWCLVPTGTPPASYGRVVRMEPEIVNPVPKN